MKEKLERIKNIRLPFDLRSDIPSKNYGIGGLYIWFILKGEKGAVQFNVSFPVYLNHINKQILDYVNKIEGCDVGYHSPKPMYEGQRVIDENCHILEGKCYYDGSGLRAYEWADEIFSKPGSDHEEIIFKKLEEEYLMRFCDE